MGLVFNFIERFFHSRSKRLAVSVAFVFLTVAISMLSFRIGSVHISFSSLLSCMMLGTIFCNICDFSAELMDRLDRWTAPIYILFFVISGAELNLDVFKDYFVVIIGLVYIVFRCIGKYYGARLSADLVKSDETVRKYLGITLFPQAGVALGMAMKAMALGSIGSIVSNIVLFSVLIYEIVGPFLTKIALTKAGEIDPSMQTSNRIKHHDKTVPTTKI
jgi:Kef-type K+ transport system membrane component KefB